MSEERQRLIDLITEELECLPLEPSSLQPTLDKLQETSVKTLREIWFNRAEWKDAIARGLLGC